MFSKTIERDAQGRERIFSNNPKLIRFCCGLGMALSAGVGIGCSIYQLLNWLL